MFSQTSSYYNRHWSEIDGYQMSQELAAAGYQLLRPFAPGKCLDIGCGDGTNAQQLTDLGFQVEGCDISRAAAAKAKKRGILAKVVDLNILPLPYKSHQYDLVWLTDVIEHVYHPDELISEIRRILKPRGVLFITTPNFSWWGNRIQLMLGRLPTDLHPEHVFWFNKSQFRQLISRNKLKILSEVSYRRLFPFPLSSRFSLLSHFDRIAPPHSLHSYSLGILAQKNS